MCLDSLFIYLFFYLLISIIFNGDSYYCISIKYIKTLFNYFKYI